MKITDVIERLAGYIKMYGNIEVGDKKGRIIKDLKPNFIMDEDYNSLVMRLEYEVE